MTDHPETLCELSDETWELIEYLARLAGPEGEGNVARWCHATGVRAQRLAELNNEEVFTVLLNLAVFHWSPMLDAMVSFWEAVNPPEDEPEPEAQAPRKKPRPREQTEQLIAEMKELFPLTHEGAVDFIREMAVAGSIVAFCRVLDLGASHVRRHLQELHEVADQGAEKDAMGMLLLQQGRIKSTEVLNMLRESMGEEKTGRVEEVEPEVAVEPEPEAASPRRPGRRVSDDREELERRWPATPEGAAGMLQAQRDAGSLAALARELQMGTRMVGSHLARVCEAALVTEEQDPPVVSPGQAGVEHAARLIAAGGAPRQRWLLRRVDELGWAAVAAQQGLTEAQAQMAMERAGELLQGDSVAV